MIILFTDYGLQGPYIGQIKAVLSRLAPDQKIINLFPDLPPHNPRASAYLLAAYSRDYPEGTVFFCVVDPGVGSFANDPVALKLDRRCYVGPDNGLFDLVARRATEIACRRITWRPEQLSASFHGRDLYAPVCAMLANGAAVPGENLQWQDRHGWPDDLNEIIYIDAFGNCMTGINAAGMNRNAILHVSGSELRHAQTFAAAAQGQPFWYENANGQVELAVNKSSAARLLHVDVGAAITITQGK